MTQNPLIQYLNTINSYTNQILHPKKKKKTYNVEISGGRQREGRGEVVEEKGEGKKGERVG